jgi:FKBP-type peptidyl-prolyl cis-trans isomerase
VQALYKLVIFSGVLCIFSCSKRDSHSEYTRQKDGYFLELISFTSTDRPRYEKGDLALVSAMFSTQSDSVFWDSHNNFNDLFFVALDSTEKKNILQNQISRSCEGDSICLLVDPKVFFDQQYHSAVPWFCKRDTLVKVNLRVGKTVKPPEIAQMKRHLHNSESQRVYSYFLSNHLNPINADAYGVIWLDRPKGPEGQDIDEGKRISVSYQGKFLSGRFLDISPRNFEFVYGTPDQVLPGLNYVIGHLKTGQNAKIILPSRLAFGENGSSNGAVPPYTPLLYEISVSR